MLSATQSNHEEDSEGSESEPEEDIEGSESEEDSDESESESEEESDLEGGDDLAIETIKNIFLEEDNDLKGDYDLNDVVTKVDDDSENDETKHS